MSYDIALTLLVLAAAIFMFVSEILRVDIAAILILLVLPWLGLIEPMEAFAGLSSNAVIAVMAVMIMGHGLEASGATGKLTGPIIELAGDGENRMISALAVTSGFLSAFMQNIGVVALYLPIIRRISSKTGFSLKKLLMPVGFAALLGGNLTMIGSGNLIILNDLMMQQDKDPFHLFSVTPVGIVLLLIGTIYLILMGKKFLPEGKVLQDEEDKQKQLVRDWNLETSIFRCRVLEDSPLIGQTQESSRMWADFGLVLTALEEEGDVKYAPWRFTRFFEGQNLLVLGTEKKIAEFARNFSLEYVKAGECMDKTCENLEVSGYAELLIPPGSDFTGRSLRELAVRKNYSINPIKLIRGEKVISGDFSDFKMRPGDILVFFGLIENIKKAVRGEDLIALTSLSEKKKKSRNPWLAFSAFAVSILLVILGFQLSLSLFTGAALMLITRTVPLKEIYDAIDWQTVFLLTGLIPLGTAMQRSGTAEFLASRLLEVLAGSPAPIILVTVALLASFLTLFMSNVASTVVLVPLVMIMGEETGIDPRSLALLAGICASNSFLLPTHQVNAFFMNAGDYSSRDFMKVGFPMTVLYAGVSVLFIYFIFL
ncbi:SLC13 family permease [Halarsenatibacter silvermanii]|uniref:TrkA-C domain-containing protein n=1 Tax=Halarsenatibacter silvermanii TaxID=321763 RepID=A0A1G9PVG9_9FIRM|nr:SLC13 family permease [Halarsenatibacter silvermanii]SDM02749.1 TrkA-C domain-containing protein [Halarsenatibacter silvermanii]